MYEIAETVSHILVPSTSTNVPSFIWGTICIYKSLGTEDTDCFHFDFVSTENFEISDHKVIIFR